MSRALNLTLAVSLLLGSCRSYIKKEYELLPRRVAEYVLNNHDEAHTAAGERFFKTVKTGKGNGEILKVGFEDVNRNQRVDDEDELEVYYCKGSECNTEPKHLRPSLAIHDYGVNGFYVEEDLAGLPIIAEHFAPNVPLERHIEIAKGRRYVNILPDIDIYYVKIIGKYMDEDKEDEAFVQNLYTLILNMFLEKIENEKTDTNR